MINNIGIIIKKRIGGKYVTLLGDFDLESSEKVFCNFFIFIFLQNIPNVQTPYKWEKNPKNCHTFSLRRKHLYIKSQEQVTSMLH